MFGLLKKNDFDAESVLIQSRIAEVNTSIINVSNTNDAKVKDTNNKLNILANVLKATQEQLKQNQSTILELQKTIESLVMNQKTIENLIIIQKKIDSKNNSANINVNTNLDLSKLIDFITNLYSDKNSLIGSPNRILEKALERKIANYLSSSQNMLVSNKKCYPGFEFDNFEYSPEADLLLFDNFQTINSIIEIKRWDSALNSNDYTCGTRIAQDRSLHYIALNKLALSKVINPNIKHYYMTVYESYDDSTYSKGYIAAKKQTTSAGYGPFNLKQNTANFMDFEQIQKEFSDVSDMIPNFSFYADVLENSFIQMYNAKETFDFEYVDVNRLFKKIYPFLKIKCKVLEDKQINNTVLNQKQIHNYTENHLANLPSNWRVRIIEVL